MRYSFSANSQKHHFLSLISNKQKGMIREWEKQTNMYLNNYELL